MMTAPPKFFRYLGAHFLLSLAGLITLLLGIIFIFEFGELLRRAAKQAAAGMDTALVMALLKLPFTAEILLPFVILFAAIYTCWRLNRTHELVVMRTAGLSVWQFLSPMMAAALVLGVIATSVLNPVAAAMMSKFRQMETVYLGRTQSLMSLSKTGIWLRQPLEKDGYALIHAQRLDQAAWKMTDATVLVFDREDNLKKHLDSAYARLEAGRWVFHDVTVDERSGSRAVDVVYIPTELTTHKIQESFSDPDTISFWRIPGYVKIMEETGFQVARLRIHFQSMLARPFLFIAMVLLAATFSLRPPRFRATGIMVGSGIAVGFIVFFMESALTAFGAAEKIPVFLAGWTPTVLGLLAGVTALLHIEDG